jgi:MFS family permease
MTTPGGGIRRGLDWLPVALAACFGLSAATMTTFPVVSPVVVSELRLNYAQTGVITAAYMLGYGLFQLPASFLGIRIGSGRVLLGATALMSVGAVLPCLVARPSIWVASRFLLGIAGAAVLPLSIHLLTQEMTGVRLVKGIGVAVSGWGTGMTLAMLGAAPLLHLAGWRAVMLAAAVLSLVVTAGVNWALPPRSRVGDRAGEAPRPARLLRQFGTNRALNWMGIINAAGTSMLICISGWLPLYVSRAFGTPVEEISAGLSPLGVGIAFGAWTGGALTVRWGWRKVVIISMLASCLLVASIPLQSSPFLVMGTAIVIGWVAMFFGAPTQSLFPFVIPEEWTALAAGYYNTIGFFGAFFASLLFGILADHLASFTAAWLSLSVISLIGIVAVPSVPIPAYIHSMPRPSTDLAQVRRDDSPQNRTL